MLARVKHGEADFQPILKTQRISAALQHSDLFVHENLHD